MQREYEAMFRDYFEYYLGIDEPVDSWRKAFTIGRDKLYLKGCDTNELRI